MRFGLMTLAAALMVSGCVTDDGGYGRPAPNWRDYDYNRPDPRYGSYDPSRYYRSGPSYQERRLGPNDRIYRGGDGRYYCRRPDGTTGLIVGGVTGGILGNIIAPDGSETLGTILGAIAGAAIGHEIDRNNIRCR
ncbi:MAG: glycine zipper 2TM domain-containing protein [Novosphingobium sp.]|nr:glycine zipper 2TM domain-containing protein [Novosphingobium sp.]